MYFLCQAKAKGQRCALWDHAAEAVPSERPKKRFDFCARVGVVFVASAMTDLWVGVLPPGATGGETEARPRRTDRQGRIVDAGGPAVGAASWAAVWGGGPGHGGAALRHEGAGTVPGCA